MNLDGLMCLYIQEIITQSQIADEFPPFHLEIILSDQGKLAGKVSKISNLELQVQELRRRHDEVRHRCSFRQKELDAGQVRFPLPAQFYPEWFGYLTHNKAITLRTDDTQNVAVNSQRYGHRAAQGAV